MPGERTGRRLRVMALIDRLAPAGGGERLAAELAASLDTERFDSSYCATRWPYEDGNAPGDRAALSRLEDAGVEVLGLARRGRTDLRRWTPLVRALRDRPIDIIHAHKFGSNAWGAVLGTLARVPVIVCHEHTWSYSGNRPRLLLDRHLIGRFADAFIAVSSADRRRMIEIERIPQKRAIFIPNGIPGPHPLLGHHLRAELGIGPHDVVIGALGHLRAQKDYPLLIEAAAILAPANPGLRVLIAGEGPERSELERLIAERGLTGVVILLGRRDDVGDVIASFDIAASSSDFEGSPLSLMESMAAGKPVVATAVGGVPDVVVDGVTGRLVPPGDAAALAAALGELIASEDERERMGEAGRTRQREQFDFALTVERVEQLYERLFSRATAKTPAVAGSASQSSL